eukprot:353873-Rhodomonas_salina.2
MAQSTLDPSSIPHTKASQCNTTAKWTTSYNFEQSQQLEVRKRLPTAENLGVREALFYSRRVRVLL